LLARRIPHASESARWAVAEVDEGGSEGEGMNDKVIEFGETWNLWHECLSSKDPNSVFSQISYMLWDTAIFRLIIESRQIQARNHIDIPELNGRIILFIDRNFFEAQVASIRRQTDNYSLYGERGVYSLRALLKDISDKRSKLTRSTFINLQNISESDWTDISEAHQRFDKLSGISSVNRSNDDLIDANIIKKLFSKLKTCEQIALYVDKYIAHSATPTSRSITNVDETRVTFREIWKAHKIIYRVMEFLCESLFSSGLSPLPLEHPTMFMDSGIPIIDTSRISNLENAWKDYRTETNSWKFDGFDLLWKWLDDENL